MRGLSSKARYEHAAALRDQLAALRRVTTTLERMRASVRHAGVVLAPDLDDRFVQAFACSGGRVVARRRLPRVGGARLEVDALLAALALALGDPPTVLSPRHAEEARIVSAALARPGLTSRAVAVDRFTVSGAGDRVARLRASIPLRT